MKSDNSGIINLASSDQIILQFVLYRAFQLIWMCVLAHILLIHAFLVNRAHDLGIASAMFELQEGYWNHYPSPTRANSANRQNDDTTCSSSYVYMSEDRGQFGRHVWIQSWSRDWHLTPEGLVLVRTGREWEVMAGALAQLSTENNELARQDIISVNEFCFS